MIKLKGKYLITESQVGRIILYAKKKNQDAVELLLGDILNNQCLGFSNDSISQDISKVKNIFIQKTPKTSYEYEFEGFEEENYFGYDKDEDDD